MDFESNLTMKSEDPSLYQAIKENKMDEIKLLLEDRRNLNDPVVTTGPFAGYTALHIACMENNDELVELLVNDYKVDVNIVAEDGTQPLHLACFYEPIYDYFELRMPKVYYLLKADANAYAEVDREMFSKHVKDSEWCPDFGDKMTLFTYTVLYDKQILTNYFRTFVGSNLNIKSLTNKTLLMYIIERNHLFSVWLTVYGCKGSENINLRDNDGIPVTHYIFHPKKYGNYRYDFSQQFNPIGIDKGQTMNSLFYVGADMYALINNDPATFIPNMAAYRSCVRTLYFVLPYYSSMSLSKALYYATLPVDENSDNYIRFHDEYNPEEIDYLGGLREERKKCTELILKDLINRLTFGLSVPEEEKQLMDKLIATDTEIKKFVDNYQTEFIDGELKTRCIELIDKKMTFFDFIMDVNDDRKLKLMLRDETFIHRFSLALSKCYCLNCRYFDVRVRDRIKTVKTRLELLKSLQKISTLTEAIPLPYELILDIVEYLSNEEFDILVKAFISP